MRGPGETSVESSSTAETQTHSEDCSSTERQRDPCASPPCKRLKQAQLSTFTSAVIPKTSENGASSSACSSIPTSPCHTTLTSNSAQSSCDGDITVTGAGGLVTGAPSPPDQNKTTPNNKDALQLPGQGQPIASHELDSPEKSPDVLQTDPNSSQSHVPNNQTSPSPGFPKTPASAMKSAEKQNRQEDKEKQRLVRQQLKEEKEKQLLEAKATRERERLQAKQRKEEERQEKKLEREKKEKERLEKKQKEEQERQERNKKKDEEKKKKEEERNTKLEEKRKREEDKKQQEEEQLRKKQRVQQSFASFFCKQSAPAPKIKPCNSLSRFQPFEIKQGMSLAPGHRKKLTEEMKETVGKGLLTQDKTRLYLQELTERKMKSSDPSKRESEPLNQDENSNSSVEIIEEKETRVVVKAKLFQFHTNNRPPYFGSWRKRSQHISPRNPFKQDTKMLDYEVDSDDEWEEEEPGESLSNSEGEDEDEAGDEEDKDGFFVPHGYLSDDEGVGDEDKCCDPDAKKEQQLTKVKQWEAELKRKCKPLKPVCIGCLWFGDAEMNATLKQFEACVLTDSLGIETTSCAASTERSYEPASDSSPAHNSKTMYVPEEAMPDLIKLLHGNAAGLVKLMNHFRRFWTAKCQKKENVPDAEVEERCPISKRQLERKIQTIATKERRGDRLRWYVHPHVLSSYGLENSTGMESSLDKDNEGRLSPLNTGLQGTPTICKFAVQMPKSKSVSCSPVESLTVITKSPNVEIKQDKASGSDVSVDIRKLLPSATSGAEKEVARIGSVSVGKDQVFIANTKQVPSGKAVDNTDTAEPMEVDSGPCVESTAEAPCEKPSSLITKLNKGTMDHSVIKNPVQMLHATPLENKQSCSPQEVICID